jgi:hypothetical protein
VTRSAITAQLKKISFKGLTKVVKFNSAGDVASNSVFVYQVMVSNNANGFSSTIKQIASTKP